MKVQFDLIIVGAGILGLSAAIQAQEHGLKVCIIEKDAEPNAATRRNFGMVGTSTLAKPETKWHEYAVKTCDFYKKIQDKTDISFQKRSGLYLANTELEFNVLKEFSESAAAYGIASQLLSPKMLSNRFDYLRPKSDFEGALIVENDYSVEPHLIGLRLLDYARSIGIELITNSSVIKTFSESGVCNAILANSECYSSSKILICHGATVDILYPDLLKQSGAKICTLQMALTKPFDQQLDMSIYSGLSIVRYPAFEICPSYAALQQNEQSNLVKDYGIHILIKQNEFGELIIGDSHEYDEIGDTPRYEQREEINQFILQYCSENIGINLPEISKRWTGSYLSHPEKMALVTEAEPNIYLISAIAGKGMTTGAGFMQEILEQKIF